MGEVQRHAARLPYQIPTSHQPRIHPGGRQNTEIMTLFPENSTEWFTPSTKDFLAAGLLGPNWNLISFNQFDPAPINPVTSSFSLVAQNLDLNLSIPLSLQTQSRIQVDPRSHPSESGSTNFEAADAVIDNSKKDESSLISDCCAPYLGDSSVSKTESSLAVRETRPKNHNRAGVVASVAHPRDVSDRGVAI